jgi:hypothetical protein
VACRKRYVGELGKPREAPAVGRPRARHTAIETRKGKPGDGIRPESDAVGTEPRARWVVARRLDALGVSYQA